MTELLSATPCILEDTCIVHSSMILKLLIHCRNAEEKTEAKQLHCRKHSIKRMVKSEERTENKMLKYYWVLNEVMTEL